MKAARPITELANPQGRLDWLASQLVARFAQANPFARGLHGEFRPEIDRAIQQALGPGNAQARKVTNAVRRLMRATRGTA